MAYAKLRTGLYIVVEGLDGSGKSTLADALHEHISQRGFASILTREPGGTDVGQQIRHMLHAGVNDAQTEFLLFAADRSLHMRDVVKPYRDAGYVVISDRGPDSSFAYQGYGRGVSTEMITTINAWSMRYHRPDVVVYLRMDPSRMRERIGQRGETETAIEQEEDAFFQRVHAGFEDACDQHDHVISVDAHQSPEDVVEDALAQLEAYIQARRSG